MSYIQIEIGGKQRGLKFNQMALEEFHKHLNLNAIRTSTVYATFYGGLAANCYAKNEEPDFTFENVVDWVDQLYDDGKDEVIAAVDACFASTQTYKKYLKKLEEDIEDLKKKTVELEQPIISE